MISLTIALIASPVASADVFFSNPGHTNSPGIDQYSAFVPTARGPAAPGVTPGQPVQPSSAVQAALRRSGGSDRATLLALVSQPQLGAPQRIAGSTGSQRGPGAAGSSLQRNVGFPQDLQGASETPLWIMVGLVLATAGAMSLRLRRRHLA